MSPSTLLINETYFKFLFSKLLRLKPAVKTIIHCATTELFQLCLKWPSILFIFKASENVLKCLIYIIMFKITKMCPFGHTSKKWRSKWLSIMGYLKYSEQIVNLYIKKNTIFCNLFYTLYLKFKSYSTKPISANLIHATKELFINISYIIEIV